MKGERKRRSSRGWRFWRGGVAVYGGVEVGRRIVEALQDPEWTLGPEGTARAVQSVVAYLVLPAIIERGSVAVKRVFGNEERQPRGREEE